MRDNHLATAKDLQSRGGLLTHHSGGRHGGVDASVTIPLSDRVPGRAAEPSRTRVGDGGGLRRILENMVGSLGFSGRRRIYRRRGNSRRRQKAPGGAQARPRCGPPLGVYGGWENPHSGVLLALDLFLCENNSRKFPADSEKLPRTTFLKQKRQQKTGTDTGHLVNRLVP